MIDAHLNFWKYSAKDYDSLTEESPQLQQDFLLPELENDLDMSGIDQVVTVQSRRSDADNRFLLDLAKSSDDLVAGIVGWAPLYASDLRLFLDQYIHEPLLKGVREIIEDSDDEQFLDNPDFDHGIRELTHRNLTFDLLVAHHQLPATIAFTDKHPNQKMVLDHCGKPPVSANGLKDPGSKIWARNIRELARRPHVYCKLSGLIPEIPDNARRSNTELLKPYVDTILKAFGPERIMFGSNWPTSTIKAGYPTWLNTVDELIHALSPGEQSSIRENTSINFYSL